MPKSSLNDMIPLIQWANIIFYRADFNNQQISSIRIEPEFNRIGDLKLSPKFKDMHDFVQIAPQSQRDLVSSFILKGITKKEPTSIGHLMTGSDGVDFKVSHMIYKKTTSSKSGQILGRIQKVDDAGEQNDLVHILMDEIKTKQKEITDLEVALKIILQNVEKEKQAVKNNISLYFENNVVPIIREIKKTNKTDRKLSSLINSFKSLFDGHNKKLFLMQNGLTAKEIEICYQLIRGQSGKEIANFLDISYLTFRTHTKNIRKKLALKRHQNLSLFLAEYLAGD